MVRIIMHGCNGAMGQVISELVKADPEAEIVAGVDSYIEQKNDYPVFSSVDACNVDADVLIDFSNPQATDGILTYCMDKELPVVLCTTGLSEEQMIAIEDASIDLAVLKSANMSLGINLLMDILGQAAEILAPAGFDIEVVEKHHRRKLDAPSGTALALADSIKDSLEDDYYYTYDRSQRKEKRPDLEIGISAVRGGTIVGEHDVIFAGMDEVITFSHSAYSRTVFAKGAVEAAKFLKGKDAGYYDMQDVIRQNR